jgi:hypothetical protein
VYTRDLYWCAHFAAEHLPGLEQQVLDSSKVQDGHEQASPSVASNRTSAGASAARCTAAATGVAAAGTGSVALHAPKAAAELRGCVDSATETAACGAGQLDSETSTAGVGTPVDGRTADAVSPTGSSGADAGSGAKGLVAAGGLQQHEVTVLLDAYLSAENDSMEDLTDTVSRCCVLARRLDSLLLHQMVTCEPHWLLPHPAPAASPHPPHPTNTHSSPSPPQKCPSLQESEAETTVHASSSHGSSLVPAAAKNMSRLRPRSGVGTLGWVADLLVRSWQRSWDDLSAAVRVSRGGLDNGCAGAKAPKLAVAVSGSVRSLDWAIEGDPQEAKHLLTRITGVLLCSLSLLL